MMSNDYLDRRPSHAASIIRAAQCTAVRWRNGGGLTLEIATWPEAASLESFLWRVSVATIDAPGPFSRFPGIDRSLTLIDGEGMVLQETALEHTDASSPTTPTVSTPASGNGDADAATHALRTRDHHLRLWDSLRFPGEATVTSALPSGATRDFNLMWRRGSCHGVVDVVHGATRRTAPPGSAVFYCARGNYRVDDVVLEAGDTYVTEITQAQTFSLAPHDDDAALVYAHITLSMPGDSHALERGPE